MPQFDVVGVGLNATDTLIFVDKYPSNPGKTPIRDEMVSLGGQVASALAACARLGMRAKYVGAVGDDERGRIQVESLARAGIDVSDVKIRGNCPTQSSYILVDASTAERTIIWRRDDRLAIDPDEVTAAQIENSRLLHLDGHDTAAGERAATIARAHNVLVSADVDTIYPGIDRVLPQVDYLVTGSRFPSGWTGERDPFRALERIQREYGMRLAATTLGPDGVLALQNDRFLYVPGFAVEAVDTTGAGDVFHGAFCYAVLSGFSMCDALEFSCAMAALNCTAPGARGGIRGLSEIREFMQIAHRRSHPDFACRSVAWN